MSWYVSLVCKSANAIDPTWLAASSLSVYPIITASMVISGLILKTLPLETLTTIPSDFFSTTQSS